MTLQGHCGIGVMVEWVVSEFTESEEWIDVVTEMLVMMPEWVILENGNNPNGWNLSFTMSLWWNCKECDYEFYSQGEFEFLHMLLININ